MTSPTYAQNIEMRSAACLKPHVRNARTHSRRQVKQIAASIERFGFTNPVLVSDDDVIIAGHGRVAAAKILGLDEIPTIRLSHLSEAERRAYVLADNKLALNAGWDDDLLAIELQGLIDLEFDVSLTGFSVAEIDLVIDGASERSSESDAQTPADQIPTVPEVAVSKPGDCWELGRHRLVCGDARNRSDFETLLQGEMVDLVFTDPPYNVAIDGHVCGSGSVRHQEFACASGEMSSQEFTGFLTSTLSNCRAFCRNGAIAFVCMDWRHMRELLDAGSAAFTELKNLCVWNKTNGGMGTFYRSKHELVFVFKVGDAPHTNTFSLGETGRYRTNVWDYAGINSFRSDRMEELAMHPTVKPVALVADAIRDCSKRGEIVLDAFGGSGSTLIAAETCGRHARLIEFDPRYCDTIIQRWQDYTGQHAVRRSTGEVFEDLVDAGYDQASVA